MLDRHQREALLAVVCMNWAAPETGRPNCLIQGRSLSSSYFVRKVLTSQQHAFTKTECDYLSGWIKKNKHPKTKKPKQQQKKTHTKNKNKPKKSKKTKTKTNQQQKTNKTGHIRKNLTQNGEPQRYSWGTRRRRRQQLAMCSS